MWLSARSRAPFSAVIPAVISLAIAAVLAAGCTSFSGAPSNSATTALTTRSMPAPASAAGPGDAPRAQPDPTRAAGKSGTVLAPVATSHPVVPAAPPAQPVADPTSVATTPPVTLRRTSPTTTPGAVRSTSRAGVPQVTKSTNRTTARTTPAPSSTTTQERLASRVVTADVLAAVNRYRRQAGVAAIEEGGCANASALHHAEAQAAAGRMFHRTLSQIEAACKMVGGENIAYGYATPAAALQAWWASPAHRANILDGRYRTMGVAMAYATDGTPYYTQVFYIP